MEKRVLSDEKPRRMKIKTMEDLMKTLGDLMETSEDLNINLGGSDKKHRRIRLITLQNMMGKPGIN